METTTYISVNETAERLGVSPGEVRRLADAAQLEHVVLIRADSLATYLEQQ